MKKRIKAVCAFIGLLVLSLTACAQDKESKGENNMEMNNNIAIVCYFSATGTTEAAAKRIAKITGADLYEIAPKEKYTAADLDWNDRNSRSSVEMNDPSARPALKDSVAYLSAYTVVYIGYPIWWDTYPRVINSFIEANNLEGKTIVPFATSGGSTISHSEVAFKKEYPALTLANGLLINGKSDTEIEDWTNAIQ